MSKKKHREQAVTSQLHGPADAAEYKIIGHDLVRLLVLNLIYLAGILILYYTNRDSQYLERFFSGIFNW